MRRGQTARPPEALALHVQREYSCRGTAVSLERAEAIAAIRLARKPAAMEERRTAEERLAHLERMHAEEARLTEGIDGDAEVPQLRTTMLERVTRMLPDGFQGSLF